MITDFNQLIGSINENNIIFDDSKIIIESIKTIMNEYPFINILKDPPLIKGKKYFEPVDILKNLDTLQNEIEEKTSLAYYEFYQKLFKIIKQTNDLHIYFYYYGDIIELAETLIISPIAIKTINDQKKLYLSTNNLIEFLKLTSYVPNYNKILEKENISIKSINDKEPFEFIRNFCKDYITFKNINAKFTYTKDIIETYNYLADCPMDINEFSLKIKYDDEEIIETNFIGINENYDYNSKNYDDNDKENYAYFKKFLKKEKNNKKNGIITNRKLLKNHINTILDNKTRNLEEKIIWDVDEEKFKCRVDDKNKVNVYFQNSFSIEVENILDKMIYCQNKFLNNDYPIVVIEDLNGGGYVLLSMLFSEIVQNLYNNKLRCSIKIGNYTNKIIDSDDLYSDFVKENGDYYLTSNEFLEDITIDKLSNNNENIRLKQRPFYLHYNEYYKNNITRNKYKKPTEIIIYTDAFSYSATSLFIKSLYHFGGAIMVGYNGDPDSDKNKFDASQSPTFVLSNLDLRLIPAYKILVNYGFYFNQLSYGPSYKNQFIEENTNVDYPEEFQVTPVDERVNIYDSYDDTSYQKFIDKAKEIFKKYNEDNQCNPNNKNLKMLNKDCDKNFNKYTYGGYECGDDGKWSNICKPFYCHKSYYFDYVNQKCVKDIIAEKYNTEYEIIEELEEEIIEEQTIEELNNTTTNKELENEPMNEKESNINSEESENGIKISKILFFVLLIIVS